MLDGIGAQPKPKSIVSLHIPTGLSQTASKRHLHQCCEVLDAQHLVPVVSMQMLIGLSKQPASGTWAQTSNTAMMRTTTSSRHMAAKAPQLAS